ncbi:hypothetical protein RFI_06885 [Reticulomyxa filosa]|uniref:CAP-Gly domain-containing protein n=1 Tax=Reticulomyxa filosa TaxID=46433 RepID=X6NWM4_RETFI|nr:hypothetical protein RFI_06885 [Reticulomyxa filosa]|eukprot:ETO30234.1 hypothetical protein RFI_06885 [Reticulomyxa filosa]
MDASGGGEAIGIELDKYSQLAHDGKGKFATKQGYGLFVRAKDIKKVYPQVPENTEDEDIDNGPPLTGENIVVNVLDRIRLQGGRTGVVRYLGPLEGMEDPKKQYIGVELDEWDPNGSTGMFQGMQYFRVNANKGAFVDRSQVVENLGNSVLVSKSLLPPEPYRGDLAKGQIVKTKYYGVGTIMFIGEVGFSEGEVVGLDMKHWGPNGSDGSINNREYFQCQPGHGYFCSRKDIETVVSGIEAERIANFNDSKNSDKFVGWIQPKNYLRRVPVIKDRVRVFDGQTGVVQFIGKVDFADGTWIGLVLDDFSPMPRMGL